MRVLHFHYRFDEFGGGERYIAELCRAQHERGDQVSVVTNEAFADQQIDGVQVKAIAASSGVRSGYSRRGEIVSIVRRFAPDVVHFHETFFFVSPFAAAAVQRHWPTVKTVHDAGLICFKDVVGETKIYKNAVCQRPLGTGCFVSGCARSSRMVSDMTAMRVLELRAARRMTRVIVNSGFMQTELERNGFDSRTIDRNPPWTVSETPTTPLPDGTPHVLFAGRLDSGKGANHLLGAMSTLEGLNWHFDVVGDGPLEPRLKALVARLGLQDRVTFHGRVPFSAMDTYYRNCTIACVPSLVPETFGLSGIEAMARGRPVVAYDSGGISEWLRDGEMGYLVPRGDIVVLAQRIGDLIVDRARAERMGRVAREQVDAHFRLPRFLNTLDDTYRAAISTFSAGPS